MRILLTANASYVPPRGGATRSNLLWLERLGAEGHACRVVSSSLEAQSAGVRKQIREEQIDREWTETVREGGLTEFARAGVSVYSVAERARLTAVLREQIREFQPDWVLVSSEDLGHVLLREADRSAPGRVIYIAHTPQFFPFGPASWNPEPEATGVVRRAAAVIAIGRHTAEYVRTHTGRGAEVIHPPIYGSAPFERLGRFERGAVTMINPCAVKGISIFLALADRFPQFPFGALPGWGTTARDRAELERRPNVQLLPNVRHIEQFLSETRVLLMPSLWYEGFGLSVMEAMLRGIPVVSSDSGGLVEAKEGTGFVVPVRGIERFEPQFDDHGMPRAVLPENDIEPWAAALSTLLTDRAAYEREAAASAEAALRFVEGIRPGQIVEFLASLEPACAPEPQAHETAHPETLSPEKRALLLKRLRSRSANAQREPS